jgi:hypothetical protein
MLLTTRALSLASSSRSDCLQPPVHKAAHICGFCRLDKYKLETSQDTSLQRLSTHAWLFERPQVALLPHAEECGAGFECRRVRLLAAGDAASILLFAAIGRLNHGELLDLDLLITAIPFWAGVVALHQPFECIWSMLFALSSSERILSNSTMGPTLIYATAGGTPCEGRLRGRCTPCQHQPARRRGWTFLWFAGWFATAPVTGAFGKNAQGGYVQPAAIVAARAWVVATPVSLVLRGLLKGYAPPTPFIMVSFAVTGTLLIGWRCALAAATTPEVRPRMVERQQ